MTALVVALVVLEQVVLIIVVVALDAITAWRTRAVEDATAAVIAKWIERELVRVIDRPGPIDLNAFARGVREGRWRDAR